MFRHRRKPTSDNATTPKKAFEDPVDELNFLLDELEGLVEDSLDDYLISIAPPPPDSKSRRSGLVDSLKKQLRKSALSGMVEAEATSSTTATSNDSPSFKVPETPDKKASGQGVSLSLQTPPPRSSTSNVSRNINHDATLLTMSASRAEQWVENLRRIAKLVVTGERVAASADQKRKKVAALQAKEEAGEPLEPDESEYLKDADDKSKDDSADKYISIFEIFFERDGLATITNLLTGKLFNLQQHQAKRKATATPVNAKTIDSEDVEITSIDMIQEIDLDQHQYLLLPTFSIATQAIQSISILVQNVSRATSLFFILSNNHVNQLLNFPLEQYRSAERKTLNAEVAGATAAAPPRRQGTPEMAELTTHFITFMKSLALRMNAETLQFFLSYPPDTNDTEIEVNIPPINSVDSDDMDDDRPLDEISTNRHRIPQGSPRPVTVKVVDVEFPLYERALEFCSAHQDSFVRVTAMNICLNTLRLATVEATGDEVEDIDFPTGSSPDGVLHNAKPLPLRERLAIAQYVCAPSRVERLTSPIFTKLATIWGVLEEQFREMDTPVRTSSEDFGRKGSTSKVARAKEKARRQKATESFNDTAFSVQDELLLLEDVLKVGLTSLNEQTIEMMFATFVYPLLLQPLLLYFQRSPVPDEILFADPLNDHSAGREIQDSDLTAGEKALIAAPAKSAFFCLSAAFQFLTNQPLLRLLFTALFHPLSPESTGETMIRAKADVACLGPEGNVMIRLDSMDASGKMQTLTERSTYEFGTITGQKCFSSSNKSSVIKDDNAFIFVLSPALAEILEFRGNNGAIVAKSRHNPYRKAIFQCFRLCSQISDLRPLSVAAVDSAVSVLPEKLVADVLFGLDLQIFFGDNTPVDEQKSDSDFARLDDRGIGGGSHGLESRLSLGAPRGGRVGFNHTEEVISSFRCCLMKAIPGGNGTWSLEYDPIAAHALLTLVRANQSVLLDAAKAVDRRCRQAAAFLADMPSAVVKFGGNKLKKLSKGVSKQDLQELITDVLFRGHDLFETSTAVFDEMIELKPSHRVGLEAGYGVPVACTGSYRITCERWCQFAQLESDPGEGALLNAMTSTVAWVKLEALSSMMNTMFATEAKYVKNKNIGGFAVKSDGTSIDSESTDMVYAPLSEALCGALFEEEQDGDSFDARPGRILSLVGHTAFPCVCEVPPSSAPLFSAAGASVVAQGITWQSLYLLILGQNLVLAEPQRHASGDGRIVTSCLLERLVVEKDTPDARSDSSARRLLVSHDSLDVKPPGLFLYDKTPELKDGGPFMFLQKLRSSLDVWFEDTAAVDLAFGTVNSVVVAARVHRGARLRKYLAQGEGSGYPMDVLLYK